MKEEEESSPGSAIVFTLIYLTFFLDNVLLTVVVPIIPDWVRGEALAQWAGRAPLAAMLNGTGQLAAQSDDGVGGIGGWQALVGAVLGAKAGAQLAVAPLAAGAVLRRGAAPALRAATAALAAAAMAFWVCSECPWGEWGGWSGWGAACAGTARAVHGAGAALAGVAGLALCARARPRALPALLGAQALGVLVGYPFGGVAYKMWSRGAPFLLLTATLLVDLGMQCTFLGQEEFNKPYPPAVASGWAGPTDRADRSGWRALRRAARRGAAAACAGAVLLTTAVMAALEPCLPLWITHKFHSQRWQTGAVFVADSAGYAIATSSLGAAAAARAVGAETLALAGQLAVGAAALALPLATSVSWLWVPQFSLGLGLGATDAALVPALLRHQPRSAPHIAALLQCAASAAYVTGPVLGGLASWALGFETTLRALGMLNLLYTGVLYRALRADPLSPQWGAGTPGDDDADEDGASAGTPGPGTETTPLKPLRNTYQRLQ